VALLEIPMEAERTERVPANRFGNLWRFGPEVADWARERIGPVVPVALELGAYRGTVLECRKRG